MIDEIDILQDCKSRHFGRDAGEESLWLLCVIAYHHELIIELREESFDSFSKTLVCPNRRSPVFLVEPIRDFERDMCHIKQVLLNISAQIAFVAKHQAIVVFPFDILEVMEIRNIGSSHVITVYYPGYSADCVELIPIIMHVLGSTVAPCRSQFVRILSHGATSRSCVLTDLYRFGINAENVLSSIHGGSYILADFLSETVSELSALIVLATGDKIGEMVGTLVLQTMEQLVFAVDTEYFRRGGKCEDFQIRELGDNTSAGYIPKLIYTISGKFFEYVEDFSELYDEVVHMRDIVNYRFAHL